MPARLVMVSSSAEMETRPQLTTTNFARKMNLLLPATLICQHKFANLRLVSRTATINFSSRERISSSQRSPTVLFVVKT